VHVNIKATLVTRAILPRLSLVLLPLDFSTTTSQLG
jgi:hypothetical protein